MAEPALSPKLIVGLGNPGSEHTATRHNAGWWFVDALAEKYGGGWRRDSRRHLMWTEIRAQDADVWMIKPTAYMNRSGAPAAQFAGFYRITPPEMLIVHDDIDLPPGIARLKYGGGHGGHNGLRDLIAHLGAEFWRLRLGVGHPGSKDLVIDAVLDRPSATEQQTIEEAMGRALAVMPEFLTGHIQRAVHRLHSGNPKPAAPSAVLD